MEAEETPFSLQLYSADRMRTLSHLAITTKDSPFVLPKNLKTEPCGFNPYLVSYSTSLSKQRGVYTLTRNRILPSSGMELPFARRRDTHWLTTLQGRTSTRAQLPASHVTAGLLDWFVFLSLMVVQCLSSRKETDMSPYRSASISFRFRLSANRSKRLLVDLNT